MNAGDDAQKGFSLLPRELQEQYFDNARKVKEITKAALACRAEKLQFLKDIITYRFPSILSDSDGIYHVAAIDGSNTKLTERLGGRFALYSAGYHVFNGRDIVSERYSADTYCCAQLGDPLVSETIVTLLRARLEKEIAVNLLEEDNADLILIDGSFFGYQGDAGRLRAIGATNDTVKTIIRDLNRLTLKLLTSNKVIGIIKRTRTRALDGYLSYKFGNDRCLLENDKRILSSIMPSKTVFAYEDLLGAPMAYSYYSIYPLVWQSQRAGRKGARTPEAVLNLAKLIPSADVKRTLGLSPDEVFQTRRCFLRCDAHVAPLELEAPVTMPLESVYDYLLRTYNPGTGLPFALDLIDQAVSLPSGISSEFADEVEAQLIQDREISDKIAVMEHFTYLNPQKEI